MASAKIFTATLCAVLCIAAVSAEGNPLKGIPVSGDTFTGTIDIQAFNGNSGNLVATGVCSGTVLADGSTVTNTPCQSTVNAINGVDLAKFTGKPNRKLLATCNVLTLNLTGLYLNVLGLVVSIPAPVVVIINAVSGVGNLLGNLLCAVTNLLNGVGSLTTLITLLNLIVTLLGAALG